MCISELRLTTSLTPAHSFPTPSPLVSCSFSPFSLLSLLFFCSWMEKLGSLEHAHPLPSAGPVAGVSVAKTAKVEGDEAAGAVSSKLFRCACIKRWLPLAYREELYQVLRLTGPLVSRGKLTCWWLLFMRCHHDNEYQKFTLLICCGKAVKWADSWLNVCI